MSDTLADDIRRLLTYSASVSIMPTHDGKWQCSARTPHARYAYSVYIHADPVEALRATCNRPIPPTNPYKCNACDDSGWTHGEIGNTCDCQKPRINLPGLPASAPLPGMPGWKP